MKPYRPDYAQNIYGGMNSAADPLIVSDVEGALVQNGIIRSVGAFTGRAGATLVGDDTGSDRIMGWGLKRNTTKFMTRIHNGASNAQVEKLSGTTWSDVASATLLKDVEIGTFESSANGKVYYFDGNAGGNVGSYDGTTWSGVAAIPKGTNGVEWKNFAWVWGVAAYPKRLYFSNIGAPETYTATDYIDFPEEIVGVKPYFNRLVVGMKRSLSYIVGSGSTDFVVSGATTPVPTAFDFGVASYESMQILGNELWGMDQEGNIRRIFRSDSDEIFGAVVSDKIQALIDGLNKNYLYKTTAAVIDGYYIFYACNGSATENNIGAYYDSIAILPENTSRWQKHTGWTPSHFCVYESSNKPELYFGLNTADTKTYKWSGVSDAGTAIEMIWRGKKNDNGAANVYKLYRHGKQEFEPIGDYDAYVKANIGGSGNNTIATLDLEGNSKTLGVDWTLGTDPLGAEERLSQQFAFKDGGAALYGYHVQMELNASYDTAIPTFYKQTYKYKIMKR